LKPIGGERIQAVAFRLTLGIGGIFLKARENLDWLAATVKLGTLSALDSPFIKRNQTAKLETWK
jgi:hypothetical protein